MSEQERHTEGYIWLRIKFSRLRFCGDAFSGGCLRGAAWKCLGWGY